MAFLEYFQFLLYTGLVSLVVLLLALAIVQRVITMPLPVIKRHKDEQFFLDTRTVKSVEFPSIDDLPTLELSVIIPAYDEEKRLPIMLTECIAFLEERVKSNANFSYEVIVVSDGSNDNTVSVALKQTQALGAHKFRVLELVENRGKGGAVRLGMLSARGRYLLFADADGATRFADLEKLESSMSTLARDCKEDAIVIGSRAHLEQEAIATRSFFRTVLMVGFHFLVWLFAVRSIRDTQCGFKLFTRSAARQLFKSIHVERWAFDVELLFLAERLKMRMAEVSVKWQEIEGSKLTPFWSSIQMGKDLFLIWFRYLIGAWQIAATQK